jgi:hypothetical protein
LRERVAREELVQRGEVQQPLVLGQIERGLERLAAETGAGEVEDRPGRSGDRQPPQRRDLVVGQRARAVYADPGVALATGASAHDDVDQRRAAGAETMSVGRAGVAEIRAVPEREHRSPAPTVGGKGAMADGVHAAMESMEPPSRETAVDLARRQSALEQLIERDDTALAQSHSRDRTIWGALTTHTVVKAPRVEIRPVVGCAP